MSSASVRVALAADGGLEMRLDGPGGQERVIPLRRTQSCDPAETLRRVLEAMVLGDVALGQDGAPTRQQVIHWERHQISTDARCPFCASERAAIWAGVMEDNGGEDGSSRPVIRLRPRQRNLGDGVSVRYCSPGDTSAKAQRRAAGPKPLPAPAKLPGGWGL